MHIAATLLGFLMLGWGVMGVDGAVFILKTSDERYGTAPPFSGQWERGVLALKLLPLSLALMVCGAAAMLWGFLGA
jgi:hypothetical protein